MSIRLRIVRADAGIQDIDLPFGTYVIGRDAGDIVLNDPLASGSHARIDAHPRGVTVTDLGSSNGTFDPEGRPISARTTTSIQLDQSIRIGNSYVTLTGFLAPAGGTVLVPSSPMPMAAAPIAAAPQFVQPRRGTPNTGVKPRGSQTGLILALIGVVLAAAAVGSYFAFRGVSSKKSGSVAKEDKDGVEVRGGASATGKYIPESATIVGGVDLAGVQGSKMWKEHVKGLVERSGKETVDAMTACKLGLDKWKSVTFGFTPDGGNDKVAIVVVAEGLGKKENLECAFGKLKEKMGTGPWTVKEEGTLLSGDGDIGYVVDDNTLVAASKAWAAEVGKLTKGEGKSVLDGAIKDIIGRADTGKHVWLAGILPESIAGQAREQLGAVPRDVAGHLDFSRGVATQVSIGVASKDEAESVKTKVEALFNSFKGIATAEGVSEDALGSVKFGTEGSAFTFEAKATDEDIAKSIAWFLPTL